MYAKIKIFFYIIITIYHIEKRHSKTPTWLHLQSAWNTTVFQSHTALNTSDSVQAGSWFHMKTKPCHTQGNIGGVGGCPGWKWWLTPITTATNCWNSNGPLRARQQVIYAVASFQGLLVVTLCWSLEMTEHPFRGTFWPKATIYELHRNKSESEALSWVCLVIQCWIFFVLLFFF